MGRAVVGRACLVGGGNVPIEEFGGVKSFDELKDLVSYVRGDDFTWIMSKYLCAKIRSHYQYCIAEIDFDAL